MTFTHALATNNYGESKFIVDANAANGTHTTITAAVAVASSGDTIFIRDGTYTEDFTLPAGVNLVGFSENAIIQGKITYTDTGDVQIKNLTLETNGDYFLSITGSNAGQVYLSECRFNVTDNDGILLNNANSSFFPNNCIGHQTAAYSFFIITTGGAKFTFCSFTGSNTVASTLAGAGSLIFESSSIQFPITTSGSANLQCTNSVFSTSATTIITTSGTGANHSIRECSFTSNAASSVSIGSGTTMLIHGSSFYSSNTNPITGAGTVLYSTVAFPYTGKVINTSTATGRSTVTGEISFDGGTNYLDYYEEGSWTPAIGGSTGNPTVAYTTQLGKYTRIGDVVHIKCSIEINTISGGSGNARITGIPFTSANDSTFQVGILRTAGVGWSANYAVAFNFGNSALLPLGEVTQNAAAGDIAVSDFANGDILQLSMTYWV